MHAYESRCARGSVQWNSPRPEIGMHTHAAAPRAAGVPLCPSRRAFRTRVYTFRIAAHVLPLVQKTRVQISRYKCRGSRFVRLEMRAGNKEASLA